MAFFQLRTIPGNTWPPMPGAEVCQIWSAYQGLDRSQWLPPEEIEALQLEQARLLLNHCLQEVPAYGKSLSQAGIVPDAIRSMADFRRIPVLERAAYQTGFADFQARRLPAGQRKIGEIQSSGTVGIPVETQQTNLSQLWWNAFYLRDLEWCGMDPRGTLAAIRSVGAPKGREQEFREGMSLPYWSRQLNSLIVSGPSHGMDLQQETRRQIEWLQRVNPDYLLSSPVALTVIGGMMADEGIRLPKLRLVQSIAESLDPEMEEKLARWYGVPIKNTYSCSEAGYLASPCPDGHGLHVHAENVILEVLGEADQPCGPGEKGRVVITTLHNFQTPFIRYQIMDEATVGPSRCPCGRGLPNLARVHGKRRPYFHLPNGKCKPCNTLVIALTKTPACLQYQIVQRGIDDLLVRIVPNKQWNDGEAEKLRKLAVELFEAPINVEFRLESRLATTAGGKMLGVVIDPALETP